MDKETYWSKFADDYEEKAAYVVGEAINRAIRDRLSRLSGLKETLELGCGPGTFSELVGERSDSLVSTDLSLEMVEKARERLTTGGIRVERADCCGLRFPDGSFDTLIMANLLHVIPKPGKAITEARRVLRPAGRLIVVSYTVAGMGFFDKLGLLYRFLKTWGKPPSGGARLTVENTKRMLTERGFEITEAELIGARMKAVFVTAISREE